MWRLQIHDSVLLWRCWDKYKKDPTRGWDLYVQRVYTCEDMSVYLVEPVRFERTSMPVPASGFRRHVEPITAPGLYRMRYRVLLLVGVYVCVFA